MSDRTAQNSVISTPFMMVSAMDTATLNVFYNTPASDGSREPRLCSFSWHANKSPESFVVHSVDLVVQRLNDDAQCRRHVNDVPILTWPHVLRSGLELGGADTKSNNIGAFLDQALREHAQDDTPGPIALKLVMPKVSGYVAQSNIIQTRLHGCPQADLVAGFLRPGEHIEAFTASVEPEKGDISLISQLEDLLTSAIGAFMSRSTSGPGPSSPWAGLDSLEHEFQNRLGLQFLMPKPIPRRRVGLVNCIDYRMSIELLAHLNMDLVVFDEAGACMQDPDGHLGQLRVSFHPIDLTPDEGFVQRLYLAARDQCLDGLTSRFDPLFEKVAQVAELLGLPTSAPSAVAIATNKYLTRITQPDHDDDQARSQTFCVKSRRELEERLATTPAQAEEKGDKVRNKGQISYPVVVKPTGGRGSYGVAKAEDEAELLAAVEWATGDIGFDSSEIMIEPYCAGPEVDINLALWDGQVTFFDVSDNAPTAGDLGEVTGTGRKDFQEGLFMYPSRLPAEEQDLLCAYMHEVILRMGFRSGVFHCEARVRDSSMHYVRRQDSDGRGSCNHILDLEPMTGSVPSVGRGRSSPGTGNSTSSTAEPSVFLLEVNARAPGYFGLYASAWTHGVDLWALQMLHCIGNGPRFRALSTAFSKGPQHDRAVLLIMPEKSGILRSGDPRPRLRRERPELAASVPLCLNFFEVGQEVTPPDETKNCFTSVMVVESKRGRADLMRTVEEVRREWTPVIE